MLTPNATVDKTKKMLSPGARKRMVSSVKTFNIPLTELVKRAPQGYKVPYIVKKICTYLEHHGTVTVFVFVHFTLILKNIDNFKGSNHHRRASYSFDSGNILKKKICG